MSPGLALAALAIEAAVGYPDALIARIGHPVTWIGATISWLDARLNRDGDPAWLRRVKGVSALALLLSGAIALGLVLESVARAIPFGWIALAVLVSSLLAQRSLHTHVADVARALEVSLDDGRLVVGKIVGRDVSRLDEAGVCRAAIESLAENFSDGVVAPALWLAAFGLPGALAYKAANTADSMIGHKTARHLAFGWAAARCDDLLNLPASRLAALLIALAEPAMARAAFNAVRQDARKHASPNAGWPEAAMAGALGLRLGGPRAYGERIVEGAWLGDGRREATPKDILRALAVYRRATFGLWVALGLAALVYTNGFAG